MNSNVKNAVFWVVLICLAVLLWAVVKTGNNKKEEALTLTQFIGEVEANRVKSVEIDGKKFAFFSNAAVDEGTAWLQDPAGDKAIVAALKAGKAVKARATSTRGTDTTDTFSLVGFSKAYAEIGKACGVK